MWENSFSWYEYKKLIKHLRENYEQFFKNFIRVGLELINKMVTHISPILWWAMMLLMMKPPFKREMTAAERMFFNYMLSMAGRIYFPESVKVYSAQFTTCPLLNLEVFTRAWCSDHRLSLKLSWQRVSYATRWLKRILTECKDLQTGRIQRHSKCNQ